MSYLQHAWKITALSSVFSLDFFFHDFQCKCFSFFLFNCTLNSFCILCGEIREFPFIFIHFLCSTFMSSMDQDKALTNVKLRMFFFSANHSRSQHSGLKLPAVWQHCLCRTWQTSRTKRILETITISDMMKQQRNILQYCSRRNHTASQSFQLIDTVIHINDRSVKSQFE